MTSIRITITIGHLRHVFTEFCREQLMPEDQIQREWEKWYEKHVCPIIEDHK